LVVITILAYPSGEEALLLQILIFAVLDALCAIMMLWILHSLMPWNLIESLSG
jgi:hypothetical protein